MNKLKLLIPTLSVATVATGIFATTSCSKSDVVEIELTEMQATSIIDESFGDVNNRYFSIPKPMTFVRNTKYIVNADMKKFNIPTFNIGTFALLNKFPVPKDPADFKFSTIIKPDVWLNGEELTQVSREDDNGPNTFRYDVDLDKKTCGIYIGKGTKFDNSIFKVEFEVKETIKDFFPIFQGWYDIKKEA